MSRKLHICHLTSVHPQGDVRIFEKECSSLAKKYSVSFIVVNGTSTSKNNVNIIGLPVAYSGRLSRFSKAVNELYKAAIALEADVYHFHDPEILRVAKKLKKAGKKVIYDVHEDLPRQILAKPYLKNIIKKPLSRLIERYENKIAAQLDGIITATPFIKDRFLRLNKNTIDINNFPILEELILDMDYSSKTGNEICYVGGITKIRGIAELIKAMSSINQENFKLNLAGHFQESDFKEVLKKEKSWNKVIEHGFLNRMQVKDIYSHSKIGMVTLHPIINYLDSLPVKMFEYMAAGLPVIASDFPLWKTIIEDNNCGICVNPLNPHEIANAINRLLNNPKEAQEMGENGKKLVIEKYNWKTEEAKLITFYTELLD